jgi:hypothetical protein
MKALLQGTFMRLHLKVHKFETFEAASKFEMDELWKNILSVDDTITRETTTKAGTEKRQISGFSQTALQSSSLHV